jgi:ketosteroid isomerase-like protein
MPSATEASVREWFERGDKTQELQFDILHPDLEWHLRADLPDSRTLRGYEDARQLVADWSAAFDNLHLEPIEITQAVGKTVVDVHLHGKMRGTEQELDMDEVWVLGWRDERIVEIREFNTREEALRSLGQPA